MKRRNFVTAILAALGASGSLRLHTRQSGVPDPPAPAPSSDPYQSTHPQWQAHTLPAEDLSAEQLIEVIETIKRQEGGGFSVRTAYGGVVIGDQWTPHVPYRFIRP